MVWVTTYLLIGWLLSCAIALHAAWHRKLDRNLQVSLLATVFLWPFMLRLASAKFLKGDDDAEAH